MILFRVGDWPYFTELIRVSPHWSTAYYSPLRKFNWRQRNFQVRSLRFATFSGGSRGKSIILLLWQDSWSAMICKMVERTWWEVQEVLVTPWIWRTEELHCCLRDIFRVKNISLLVVSRKRASSRADSFWACMPAGNNLIGARLTGQKKIALELPLAWRWQIGYDRILICQSLGCAQSRAFFNYGDDGEGKLLLEAFAAHANKRPSRALSPGQNNEVIANRRTIC